MVNILYLREIKCNLLFNENNKDTCIYKLILFLHVLNHVKALKRYISVTLQGTWFFSSFDKTKLGFNLI